MFVIVSMQEIIYLLSLILSATKKINVRKGEGQHEIFEWLTDSRQNGWNNKQPSWNFAKYLVNEEGILTHYFDPAISPLSEAVIGAVHG